MFNGTKFNLIITSSYLLIIFIFMLIDYLIYKYKNKGKSFLEYTEQFNLFKLVIPIGIFFAGIFIIDNNIPRDDILEARYEILETTNLTSDEYVYYIADNNDIIKLDIDEIEYKIHTNENVVEIYYAYPRMNFFKDIIKPRYSYTILYRK